MQEAEEADYTFPYLVDESQEVARAYRAACTPDFFLLDGDRRVVYRGQFDPSRPGSEIAVTGEDLRAAVDALLEGRPIPEDQVPGLGCNIKWKPGNEPDLLLRLTAPWSGPTPSSETRERAGAADVLRRRPLP